MEEPVVFKHLVYVQSVEHRADCHIVFLGSILSMQEGRSEKQTKQNKDNQLCCLKWFVMLQSRWLDCTECVWTHRRDLRLSFSMLFSGPSLSYEARCSSVAQHNTKRKYVKFVFPLDGKQLCYTWHLSDLKCRENCKLTVFAEDRRGDEVLEDAAVSVEWTNHLTPHQELAHLLCKLPQFLLVHSDNRLYDTSFIGLVSLAHEDTENTQKGEDEEKCNVPYSHRGETGH